MKEMVFLLEELSAEEMLKGLLPRLLDQRIKPVFIVFEGKQDLEKQLARKLRGYLNPEARFIVLRDQDSHPDCRQIKRVLLNKCIEANRLAVSLVRIACRELESFYLADLSAVERALQIPGIANKQSRAKFRKPDYLESPSRELDKLTDKRYQKVSGSRLLGPHLDTGNDRSDSFRHLLAGIRRMERELLA
jgi:hypothetical protein